MKVIIAGTRTFNDYKLLEETLDDIIREEHILDDITIISGTANGADKLGEIYAHNKGYKVLQFRPDWDKYGKSAGYIRNTEMAEAGDILVAFWDGKSKGTEHMINIMKNKNKHGFIIKYDN
ncbi:MAG: DUF2493 domain-containing protein [Bacilli bacterium]|nr:DUF2493 domain-containing protein [Bacilli bacterium]